MHLILDIESLLKFIKRVNHVLMLVQVVLFRRKNENENMCLEMLLQMKKNARMQELLHLVHV